MFHSKEICLFFYQTCANHCLSRQIDARERIWCDLLKAAKETMYQSVSFYQTNHMQIHSLMYRSWRLPSAYIKYHNRSWRPWTVCILMVYSMILAMNSLQLMVHSVILATSFFVTQIRRYNQNKHNYFQNFNWLEFCVYLLCIIMRISCSINNYAV